MESNQDPRETLAATERAALAPWIEVVPRLRSAPPEFVPVIRAYFIGYALALALVVAVYLAVDSRVAAAVAAVVTSVGLFTYEKRYEAAADAVRKRAT